MDTQSVHYKPIGVIRSGHTLPDETPIQPIYASGCRGSVEIFPEYAEALSDLEGFSHIYLIYHFHRAGPAKLRVQPFLQGVEHGVFATRAPCRPNPIGISVVRLLSRRENVLEVDGMDILDGTPLLDIKPYAGRFDRIEGTRDGWHQSVDESDARRRGRRNFAGAMEKEEK